MIPGFDDTIKNAVVPATPAVGAGAAPGLNFPGITKPSTDMQAVRDGRRSTLQAVLVDLSAARSIAAGTALQIAIQGNVFMSDPLYDLTGVAQAGIARVHFQDVSVNPNAPGTYVSVLPTAVYKVPFTQVLVENFAQAGKFLYIVYGTDVDVVPGGSQQVSATIINQPNVNAFGNQALLGQNRISGSDGGLLVGSWSLFTRDVGFAYGASYASITLLAANTANAIIPAASNVNGAIVWSLGYSTEAAATAVFSVLAKAGVPANAVDGDPLLSGVALAGVLGTQRIPRAVFVPAGKGVYRICSQAEGAAFCDALVTIL